MIYAWRCELRPLPSSIGTSDHGYSSYWNSIGTSDHGYSSYWNPIATSDHGYSSYWNQGLELAYDRMKFLLLPNLCILGNWQLDNHVRCTCRMLLTEYSQSNNSWNDDLLPLSEVFLDGPLCVFYHRLQGFEIWHLHFVVIPTYVDCFEPPVTEGSQLLASINKCTSNVLLQSDSQV
jgi:hypothetical protein